MKGDYFLMIFTLVFLNILLNKVTFGQTSNGCGPGQFVINNGLKEIGEGNLIKCCNQHDLCYSQCLGKEKCDNDFADCLTHECENLPVLRVSLCKMDTFGMVAAVRLFGNNFYCKNGQQQGSN